ncbi:MAG: hypothetical protein RL414_1262 [Actinomycetota bacterium]
MSSGNPFGALPKNLGQVVDLSQLGKPPVVAPDVGLAITQQNLVSEILPLSNSQVVIVLCWSPRSAQAQEIMKVLADFYTQDLDGVHPWIFATVNVDVEAAVAQALQVQSVPLAIAIIQEQVVPLFESVPPTAQVRMVIDKVIALAAERGIGNPVEAQAEVEAPMEPEEIAAMEALEKGDFATAISAYKAWLKRTPNNSMAELGLAQVELMQRIDGVDASMAIASANAAPLDHALQITAADIEIAQGNYESAFSRLIGTVKSTSGDEQKLTRDHLLNLFKLVDPTDPGLLKARQALASALF